MKNLLLSFLFISSCVGAQVSATQKKNFVIPKAATVNFSELKEDYAPKILVKEMPKQGGKKKEYYNYPENAAKKTAATTTTLAPLVKGLSFQANVFGGGTPNDNDIAISDSGRLISVINSYIYVRNMNTFSVSPYKSLYVFSAPVNSLNSCFDPKVMYDPDKDRFVLVCLVGDQDYNSKIIIGFSQTNNPAGAWNLYSLPGNPLNNTKWSDYPMISMSKKELFLTVNLLYPNMTWQAGFHQTVIWQMKKDSGYAGLPLGSVMHYDIKYNNKFIRNLCPVKGGSGLKGPNMYFISNRNLANQNDSVFLVDLTDTIGAPTQTLTVKCMTASVPYYFPNPGRQIAASDSLATNDVRNLGAFYENNKIQYVHNTTNPSNSLTTIYYGVIDNPTAATPTVTGYYLQNDTMDFGYPNIAYAGTSASDDMSIITFDHTSNKVYAGVSAVRADAQGNFSPILRIQNGTSTVNLLSGSLERWGDYSGSQRRYSNPGEVWMSGYIGTVYSGNPAHTTWVCQLATGGISTSIPKKELAKDAKLFPNPAKDVFTVEFFLEKPEVLSFDIYDSQGKLVKTLLKERVKGLDNVFSFKTDPLSKGVYILKITGDNNTNITKRVIVE
jgi:hypothetical protein